MTVKIWSVTQNSRTKFYVGRKPPHACLVGEFKKLYDPITGTTSDFYSYQPARFASQPSQKWLYERMPR